ncbi:MAG: hypothetical protein HQK86_03955, partial [Nitrospinae bacterium]|nr:hypothetical protein [Nitrospinota bacterium]
MRDYCRRFGIGFLAIVASSVLFLPVLSHADAKKISDVRLKGLSRADKNTIRYYIHSRAGEPHDPVKAAEDIRKLYDLGFFDDIRLDLSETSGGVELTYIFKEKPFVREIILKGLKEVEENAVRPKIKAQKGTFFRQDLIPWDKDRIKQVYRNKGFYFSDV